MTRPASPVEASDGGKWFWIGLAAGGPMMAVGVIGLLSERRLTHPLQAATYFLGAAIGHDLALVPIVLFIGVMVRRLIPPAARRWVQAGLVVSAPVLLFSWPFIRKYGQLDNNPSILPRNYGRGAVVTVTAVWLAGLTVAIVHTATRRRRRRPSRHSDP